VFGHCKETSVLDLVSCITWENKPDRSELSSLTRGKHLAQGLGIE